MKAFANLKKFIGRYYRSKERSVKEIIFERQLLLELRKKFQEIFFTKKPRFSEKKPKQRPFLKNVSLKEYSCGHTLSKDYFPERLFVKKRNIAFGTGRPAEIPRFPARNMKKKNTCKENIHIKNSPHIKRIAAFSIRMLSF